MRLSNAYTIAVTLCGTLLPDANVYTVKSTQHL